jgi:hypothetical protein
MVVEESAMTDEVLNTLVVLGRRLLLVDVGGGFETHLCEATSDSTARAALDTRRALPDSLADALERGGDDDGLDAMLDRVLETARKPTSVDVGSVHEGRSCAASGRSLVGCSICAHHGQLLPTAASTFRIAASKSRRSAWQAILAHHEP